MSPSEIEGIDDLDAVYAQFKPLDTIYTHKSYDEIKTLMDVHFFGADATEKQLAPVVEEKDNEEDDFTIPQKVVSSESVLSEQDKKMQDILKDL